MVKSGKDAKKAVSEGDHIVSDTAEGSDIEKDDRTTLVLFELNDATSVMRQNAARRFEACERYKNTVYHVQTEVTWGKRDTARSRAKST